MELIDRQAAIDALADYIHNVDKVYSTGKLSAEDCRDASVSVLEDLPSAEPQIIRCENCKHRDPEDKKCDCGHDIRWQLPRRDDWYCADAERRKDG